MQETDGEMSLGRCE